jgi:anti-sigma factor RsiW
MNRSNDQESHPTEAELVLALDGELEASRLLEISSHVQSCDACRAQYQRFEWISNRIADYHRIQLQSQVRPEQRSRIARAARRGWHRPAVRRAVIAVSSTAAALACILWSFGNVHHSSAHPPAKPERAATLPHVVAAAPPVVSFPAPTLPAARKRARPKAAPAAIEDSAGFFALPFSDSALPLNDATVIRVQLAAEELQITGLPIVDARPETPVQADLLIGIDGLPRGIRLIHQ